MSSRSGYAMGILILICGVANGCGKRLDPVELFQHGDYVQAFRIFSDQANNGNIAASNYLGTHYYLGLGVKRDFEQAVRWFEVAALAEDPQGQRNLGVMYLRGLGVEKDFQQAYGWLYFAYEGGNLGAKQYLDLMNDNVTPNAGGLARRNVRRKIDAHAAKTLPSNSQPH
ncbi:MAG: TPR repeat protein [Gammaproteobacteria bacterium]|jgi:TPR repeat protein